MNGYKEENDEKRRKNLFRSIIFPIVDVVSTRPKHQTFHCQTIRINNGKNKEGDQTREMLCNGF